MRFHRTPLKNRDDKVTNASDLTLRQSFVPLCLVTILFFLWVRFGACKNLGHLCIYWLREFLYHRGLLMVYSMSWISTSKSAWTLPGLGHLASKHHILGKSSSCFISCYTWRTIPTNMLPIVHIPWLLSPLLPTSSDGGATRQPSWLASPYMVSGPFYSGLLLNTGHLGVFAELLLSLDLG